MVVESIGKEYEKYIHLLDSTLKQLESHEFFSNLEGERNSIAILLKHISGNVLSRLTNFLREDGEKEWRNRDSEFELTDQDDAALLSQWERAKNIITQQIGSLKDQDMAAVVTVRGESMTAVLALVRNLAHFAYHVGQIVFIAKVLKGDKWINQSIPLGQSQAFNAARISPDSK
jgi:Protein of unknown function (DUF1572)